MNPPPGPANSRLDERFSPVCPLPAPAGPRGLRQPAGQDQLGEHARHQAVTETPYFRIKPAFDRAVAAVLAVIALPVIAAVALAALLCQGRPVFYRQSRVGKNGRLFLIWKFRTMRREAERQTGPVWSCDQDQRITWLGRWLRLSHIDELPQIMNVLAGEMSLVGPRPERPEFVNQLALELPNYMQRLQVPPGITGLAQLTLGYDRCIADVRHKLELDLQYIRTATLGRDVLLLLRTLPCVLDQLWQHRRARRADLEAPAVAQQVIVPVPHGQSRTAPPERSAGNVPARVVPRRRTA